VTILEPNEETLKQTADGFTEGGTSLIAVAQSMENTYK